MEGSGQRKVDEAHAREWTETVEKRGLLDRTGNLAVSAFQDPHGEGKAERSVGQHQRHRVVDEAQEPRPLVQRKQQQDGWEEREEEQPQKQRIAAGRREAHQGGGGQRRQEHRKRRGRRRDAQAVRQIGSEWLALP